MKTHQTISLSIIATTYIFSHVAGLFESIIMSPQCRQTILCAGLDSDDKITARLMWAIGMFLTSVIVVPILQSRNAKQEKKKAAEAERQRLLAEEAARQAALQAEEARRLEEERRQSLCPQCGGIGQTEYGQICPTCDGSGMRKIEVCPTCCGRGVNAAGCACPRCGGCGQFYLN